MVLRHRIELHPLVLQTSVRTSYTSEALMAEGKRIELSTFRWDGFQDHLCTLHPTLLLLWSEWQDSNLRPSAPKADALPNCATLRNFIMVDPLGIEPRPDGLKDRCPNLLCEGSIISTKTHAIAVHYSGIPALGHMQNALLATLLQHAPVKR